MKQDNSERPLGLSTAQVAGSALAATSSALVASWAGTTGTIIGAAVGSVVATIGAATYTWWLRRTSEAVRRKAAQVRLAALATQPIPRKVTQGPLRAEGDQEAAESESESSEETSGRGLPWGKVLIASAAVTVTALAGITTIEAITGEPISSLIGQDDAKGTSVGHLVGSDDDKTEEEPPADDEAPAPSESPSPTSEPSEDTSDLPVPTPSTTTTPEPTEPTDGPPLPQESPGASTLP